jgi:hypothetical protein
MLDRAYKFELVFRPLLLRLLVRSVFAVVGSIARIIDDG